ncbi:hypothetical protein KEM60_02837 [Austwickia sp. TVS 96-490-7B]|nr:hypothetical protein [Austwickia sp. TVS 96-490-7B]
MTELRLLSGISLFFPGFAVTHAMHNFAFVCADLPD